MQDDKPDSEMQHLCQGPCPGGRDQLLGCEWGIYRGIKVLPATEGTWPESDLPSLTVTQLVTMTKSSNCS